MQQNNMNMTSDRNLISAKELQYVKDFLSWELLAMKKCNEAASRCTDQQIQALIKQTGKQHEQQYEQILSHLQ